MRRAAVALSLCIASAGLGAETLIGDWHGAIEVKDDAPLRVSLHVRADGHGLKATLDSDDEGGTGLRVDSFRAEGSAVEFVMRSVAGSYQGIIAANGSSIDGFWTQNGLTLPLTWERGPDPDNVVEPISDTEALQKGRTCARLFESGDLSHLWSRLSPVAQQEFVNPEKLRELRFRVRGQGKWKAKMASENVRLTGVLRIYKRLEKFDRPPGVFELQLAFNPAGQVAQFSASRVQP